MYLSSEVMEAKGNGIISSKHKKRGKKTAHQNSIINKNILKKKKKEAADFPDGPVVKNGPGNEGVTGSIPGPGKSQMLQGS